MEEIWKDAKYIKKDGTVVDFEGWYQVSNLGRVRSFREHGGGQKINVKSSMPTLRKLSNSSSNYKNVSLRINGKTRMYLVHRLVLSTFTDIPEHLKTEKHIDVNHIDEDKTNNKLSNLEWCTRKQNNMYGTRLQRAMENGRVTRSTREWKEAHSRGNTSNARPVVGVNVKTGQVVEFESMTCVTDFLNIKLADRSVSAAIRGRQKTAYGYYWYYKEDYKK